MPASDVFDTDLDNFELQVMARSHSQCVLVDFWADWCPPCIALDPVLKKVVAEYQGKIVLAKVEVDEGENMKLAGRYQVRGFPTILLIQNGEEKSRFSSMRSPAFVRDFIDQNCLS
jgi:putative thioredoxin